MTRFEASEITKLLDVLIGKTEAVGETNEDERRLDNLKTLIDVTNWCLDGLQFAMASGFGRAEYSMAEISYTAQCALDEYGRWIADILDEQISDRKTENCSEKTNNCDTCRFELYCPEMCEGCCEWDSHYEPKTEPQTETQTETQNSNKNSNVISVYDGVSEAVRCAMCNNPNKSDRGCDGACSYDEALYKKIIDAIHNCQYEPKDEPQFAKDINVRSKDEPQTECDDDCSYRVDGLGCMRLGGCYKESE